jgi:hypothetical protein
MRKLLTLWIALAAIVFAACSPVQAQNGGMFNMGRGPFASGGATFSIAFTQASQEASGGTTITYNCGSSCSFGASDPNRVIAVFIGARMTTNNTISSVTIGGNSASLATGSVAQVGTNGENSAVYYFALGAGATTGNVVVTYGAATARTCISIYRIVTSTPTPSASGQNSNGSGSTSLALTAAKPASGGGLAGLFLSGTSAGVSWTNATVDSNLGTGSQCSSANVTASNPSVIWTTSEPGVASATMWNP